MLCCGRPETHPAVRSEATDLCALPASVEFLDGRKDEIVKRLDRKPATTPNLEATAAQITMTSDAPPYRCVDADMPDNQLLSNRRDTRVVDEVALPTVPVSHNDRGPMQVVAGRNKAGALSTKQQRTNPLSTESTVQTIFRRTRRFGESTGSESTVKGVRTRLTAFVRRLRVDSILPRIWYTLLY